jgi:hypothetical protein
MTMSPISRGNTLMRFLERFAVSGAILLMLALLLAGVLFSPVMIGMLGNTASDWGRLSDIGQAYGAVSALLSAAALGAVVALQRGQTRRERTWRLRELHLDIVKLAMDEPMYAQCWGPRMAPENVDERLFYYVNLVVLMWAEFWEAGELRDAEVKSYVASLFESEVAREYWDWHGKWQVEAASGRRLRFLRIVDQEYDQAVLTNPPSRRLEATQRRRPVHPSAGPAARTIRRSAARGRRSIEYS